MKPLDAVYQHLNKKPLIGVIGGMGTQATASFYEMLHSLQQVSTEQEYLDVLLYSKPTIPDRTKYIIGQSIESPLEPIIGVARTLEAAGATCIALPCVTSHYFYAEISRAVKVPILHIPNETALVAAESGIKKICLLATDGTIRGKVFHTAFEQNGIEVLIPPDETQSDLMKMIYDVKKGTSVSPEELCSVINVVLSGEAEAVVLGCTEFCVITSNTEDKTKDNPSVINTLKVLAEAAIRECRSQTPSREHQP